MEMGKEARLTPVATPPRKTSRTNFSFLFLLFVLFLVVGCASPGEPIERRAPTPVAVTDLAAHQSGNSVILTFTMPRETVQRRSLKQTPTIEILRRLGTAVPTGTSPFLSSTPAIPLITIPSAMVDHYMEQGHIRYVDELQASDFVQQPSEVATYIVRTRITEKNLSTDSNLATVLIYPLPDAIDDLKTQTMSAGSGVMLTWTAPQKTPVGPAPAIRTYRIYRVEVPSAEDHASKENATVQQPTPESRGAIKLKHAFAKIAETPTPSYEDKTAEFGKTYTYSVRSVTENTGEQLESSDSKPATITIRDVYPPSTPQGLVAVFIPKVSDTPAHLELSWAINPETDVAGYNVYRSEQQGTPGTRLNPELLLTPAFRDMSAVAGRNYFYEVTAVDRSGNESSPAPRVAAEMPAESQQ